MMNNHKYLNKILKNKWSYVVCGILFVIIAAFCYECAAFGLGKNTDLPAYAAKEYGIEDYEVVNRIDVQGVSLFLVDSDELPEYLAVAYPRSVFFSRYTSEYDVFPLRRESVDMFICEFALEGFSPSICLTDPSNIGNSLNEYSFNLSFRTEKLEYSVINSQKAESGVLAMMLTPYVIIACIIAIIMFAVYILVAKRVNREK